MVDRTSEAGQHLEQAAKLCVRSGQFDKAAEMLESCLQCYSQSSHPVSGTPYGRVVLAMVLVQEQRGDCVAASKVSNTVFSLVNILNTIFSLAAGVVTVGRIL